MGSVFTMFKYSLPALLIHTALASSLWAQLATGTMPTQTTTQPNALAASDQSPTASQTAHPPYQVAERSETAQSGIAPQLAAGQPNEHPLMPVLRWAYSGVGKVETIHDYSATLAKRERVNGKLNDYDYMFVKLRQKPFSVYLYFLSPADLKGQEVIFVDGQNEGCMLAHTVGFKDSLVGTVKLKPDGVIAMKGQRYPLTELGILNLVHRLVEVGEKDVKYGECDVKFYKGAKINDRICTCIEVIHPVPRQNFLFHLARIFVDDELNIPIRYESYDWPKEAGGSPELIEEYTYLNLKLNNGFTDADFDKSNPNYKFR
jgi:hypothetical protein